MGILVVKMGIGGVVDGHVFEWNGKKIGHQEEGGMGWECVYR